MDISTSVRDSFAIIHLKGRFDFTVHRIFRDAVQSALTNTVIREITIDLGGVDYIDSSALGMLLLLRENAKTTGRPVSLAGATSSVNQALNIANFEKLFTYK